MIYSNQHDHDYGININEQDKSPSSHLMFHNQQKVRFNILINNKIFSFILVLYRYVQQLKFVVDI